jgi:hypothetical protein
MIADSFSVITEQWRGISGILLLIVFSQTLLNLVLRNIFGNLLTASEYFALAMAGWILPAALLALLWLLLGFIPAARFDGLFWILPISALTLLCLRLRPALEPDSAAIFTGLLLCLLISILLRLVFISKALLPSYFDSAQHYLLIRKLLEQAATGEFTLTRYYHLGFHVLTAFAAFALQTDIAKTMLIVGQMTLAVMPLSVFFLIKHVTRSGGAGIFAILLAAGGWYMPAHAVDWGKYPALLSLALVPFVLSLAYLLSQNKGVLSTLKRRALYVLLGAGALVSVFVHTRSPVIFGIAFVAWSAATWRQKLRQWQQYLLLLVVLAVLLMEGIYIQKQEVLGLLFDAYLKQGIWITLIVLFLFIFAQRAYPPLSFACVLAMCLLLGSLFVPVVGLIPGYGDLTLLDRPYVQMILYLPLALLGGLGLAGLEQSLRPGPLSMVIRNAFVVIFMAALVWVNTTSTYDFYPSDCCVLVGKADLAAMAWMDEQLPVQARIGVSSTELKVMTLYSFEGNVGADAGIWITPLINRSVRPLSYTLDFEQQATHVRLCQLGITHVYVGGPGQNFNDSQLSAHPEWYQVLLSISDVKLYEVIACN